MINRNTLIIKNKRKNWKLVFLILLIILIILFVNTTINLANTSEEINLEINHLEGCICPIDNNLPIIIINTNNQKIETGIELVENIINTPEMVIRDKTPKYNAKLSLYEPGSNGYTSICEVAEPTLETDIVINIRGQSSILNPKKQYTINFKDEFGEENPTGILGMPKHDKWVLNGSYGDKSLIRNYLAYEMAGQVMDYAPRTRFVEVYLNDDGEQNVSFENHYIGVYLLIEKIERSEDRVDIERNEDKYNDISFIIARDKINVGDTVLKTHWSQLEDDYIIDDYGRARRRTVITVNYPGSSILTKDYENRIIDYLNRFEYTLRSSNFNDSINGYRSFIDVDSFASFAMVNEIFKNIDGGDVSTFFYKDIGGLMKAGPVWDFDLTLGNTPSAQVNEPTGFRMINTLWFDRLFQDPYFAGRYSKILYPYYRSNKWSSDNISKMINEGVEELGPAVIRNSERWYVDYNVKDYEMEIDSIKTFLGKRLKWMDENIHLVKRLVENKTE